MNTLNDFVIAAQDGIEDSSGNVLAAVFSMADFGRTLPAWWSKERDRTMRNKWRDGTLLSGLVYAAATKLANMPIRVVPRDPNIASHQRLAVELTEQFAALSEFGSGLGAAIAMFAEDYLTTDNGGFFEIVGEGGKDQPIVGVPYGLRHLDSLACDRTDDPLLPVIYHDSKGNRHPLHHSRVMAMNQLPTSRRDMNGVGFCAVSRSIEVAVRFQDMNTYVRSKIGGTSAKKLLVGRNISGREITKALVAATALRQELGDIDPDTVAIGGTDVDLKTIDLYSFPEFSEEDQLRTIMTVMAIAWGLEFNEVMALALGKASDEVSLQRSRGRLQTMFANQFAQLATYKLVPRQLRVEIDFSDDFLDQQQEVIADIRARNLERMVNIGVMTPNSARRKLVAEGYISETDYTDMCLADGMMPDGTSIERAFFDQDYDALITIPRDYLMLKADPQTALDAIAANRFAVQALFPATTAMNRHYAYKIALGALDWLAKKYGKALEEARLMAERQQELAAIGRAEPDPGEQQPDEDEEPEKGEAFKALPDIGEIAQKAIDDFYSGLSVGADESGLRSKLEAALLAAWLLATGETEPDEEGRKAISDEVALFAASAAAILARYHKGVDMMPTAERMAAQVERLYWSALILRGIKADAGYHWELGATEDHCGDCLHYSGVGSQSGAFWKEAYDRGHFPKSPQLECTGFHCDCRLIED